MVTMARFVVKGYVIRLDSSLYRQTLYDTGFVTPAN
jgi:hypothetical protein